jgi:hypothetical protein
MKIDLKKVLAVSEHPGLYLFISDSKSGAIVESIADKKRTCMSPRARMTSLSDIAVYTNEGELRLKEVLERMKNLPAVREIPNPKSDAAILRKFFEEVIPDYDRDRFYGSHMKKILEWFLLLRNNDALDFEEEEKREELTNEEQSKEEPPVKA